MDYERTVPHEMITEMVRQVDPEWHVADATPAVDGHHVVYHLDVETPDGCQHSVLKATPESKPSTCGAEARLLAILDAHTPLPVPDLLGVVDEHDELPAPFLVTSTLPGVNYERTDLDDLSVSTVDRLAHSTGRQLAALHSLDAVDAYGLVDVDQEQTLTGERPSAAVERVGVADPTDSWLDYLATDAERVLSGLESTRFDELCSAVRPVLEARVSELSGPFEPVLGRIDQSLDNVLVDDDGTVTGLLDWEFAVATTPSYDLSFVVHSLSGGHWKLLPDVPNHEERIRSAMLDGYASAGGRRVVDQFHENRDCYSLLAALHAMLNFDDWFDQAGAVDASAERRARAADRLRKRVTRLADRS